MSSSSQQKEYRCYVTDEIIPQARVEYLLSEGVPEHMLTSITGSNQVYKPRKILVLDDEANYIICDSIDETRIYAAERFGNLPDDEEETEEEIEVKTFKVVTKEEEEDEI